MSKQIQQDQTRTFRLERSGADEDARTVPASLSSETPVERFFGTEILVHDIDAINLERAGNGLPMLFGHDHHTPIGRVTDVRLDPTTPAGKALRGILRFSRNAKAEEVWQDVRDGMLTDISVGYRIDKWEEENNSDVVRVTRWTPLEASVVAVPADHRVGINRQRQETTMAENTDAATVTPTEQRQENPNITQFTADRNRNLAEGRAEGQRIERERQTAIRQLFDFPHFQAPEYQDLMRACIDNGLTVNNSQRMLLEMVGSGIEPVVSPQSDRQTEGSAFASPRPTMARRVEAGTTDLEKFVEGASLATLVRAQVERDPELVRKARASEFHGVRLSRLAEVYLARCGVTRIPHDERELVGMALTRAGLHGSSDFANLLESISTKSVLAGWGTAPETWQAWCRQGSLPDFKTASRTGISEFSDLEIVYENGEYKQGTVNDLKEPITLVTYGKMFHISRQAIINDDLDQLTRIPMKMGRAANRKVGDLAYAVLTSNPTLNQDSAALFVSGHANYVASGSGAAPSVATINAARTAIATQTDPSGNATLNYSPRFLIVPKALEGTGLVLSRAEYDPAGTAGTLTPNIVAGTFDVVADARLDAFLATGWYMACDPQLTDTVEVAFLNGASEPYMEQMDPWNKDGVSYKVRIDAGAAPLDFRGLYYNYGA